MTNKLFTFLSPIPQKKTQRESPGKLKLIDTVNRHNCRQTTSKKLFIYIFLNHFVSSLFQMKLMTTSGCSATLREEHYFFLERRKSSLMSRVRKLYPASFCLGTGNECPIDKFAIFSNKDNSKHKTNIYQLYLCFEEFLVQSAAPTKSVPPGLPIGPC